MTSLNRIAVVVKGWPRLSETFIAQELVGLEARGLSLELWSLRHPTDTRRHALAGALRAKVNYLPEYLWQEPLRVLRGWLRARRMPGYASARRRFLADWRRDPTPNRGRRFGQACVLAAEMGPDTAHLYAHFIHTPGSVARYAALMRGLDWSASAHAKDIWTTPDWEKREKLAEARWCATCTKAGRDHLDALAPGKVRLVYHGLDFARWPAAPARSPRDGTDPNDPVVIVSVGRLVPKKGYDDVIAALARLGTARAWRFVHVGGGPLRAQLQAQAEAAGIAARIEWRGARDQADILATLRAGDMFVLASRIAADGDRDGLPNVLMEAASQGLPLVASDVAAIPELVVPDCGVLVPPGDVTALATALGALVGDPARRVRLGAAADTRVRDEFPFARGLESLYDMLAACASPPTPR
ncbi:MAG: glycosyltransferase family 4 protein [Rhodospirillales bacterium]|nr:glycosyltransferase family 4 protein [Rhodospirillales bacterium]